MRRTLLAAALVIGATAPAPGTGAAARHRRAHPLQPRHLRSGLPPPEAIKVLRLAGLRKAFVSSSSDDGTQMLLPRPRRI